MSEQQFQAAAPLQAEAGDKRGSVDNRPSNEKGRDSVTDAVDAYMLNGNDAVEGWFGAPSEPGNNLTAIAYMNSAAVVHGAELIAEALDRLSAAITLKHHAKPGAS